MDGITLRNNYERVKYAIDNDISLLNLYYKPNETQRDHVGTYYTKAMNTILYVYVAGLISDCHHGMLRQYIIERYATLFNYTI